MQPQNIYGNYGGQPVKKSFFTRKKLIVIGGLLLLLVVVLGILASSKQTIDGASSKGVAKAFIVAIDDNNADLSYSLLTDKAKSYEIKTIWDDKVGEMSKAYNGSVEHQKTGELLAENSIVEEGFVVASSESKSLYYRVDVTMYKIDGKWLVNSYNSQGIQK